MDRARVIWHFVPRLPGSGCSTSRPVHVQCLANSQPRFYRSNTHIALNTEYNNDPLAGPLALPGHGLPIDHTYYSPDPDQSWSNPDNPTCEGFAHGFSSWIQMRRNLVRELHMIRVMDVLTGKPNWNVKVFDESILARWKLEATNVHGKLISELAWEWIVKELVWKATKCQRTGYTTTLETGSTIVKADAYIGGETSKRLQYAVKPLIDVGKGEKDWHPGSDGKVLNLVHPSFYPLVYGRTRILPDHALGIDDCLLGKPDDGVVIPIPQTPVQEERDRWDETRAPYPDLWSTNFQWLPCDVEFVGSSGSDVQIVTYINNLDPFKHRDLYHIIEHVISKSLQPWNEVLSWKENESDLLRIVHDGEIKQTPDPPEDLTGRILIDLTLEDTDGQKKAIEAVNEYLALPDNPNHLPIPDPDGDFKIQREPFDGSFTGEWWHNDDLHDQIWAKWARLRVTEHPEPGVDKSFEDWKKTRQDRLRPKLEETFRERGLQVIVKLSSIELTPDKPDYEGGNWHLEGKLNEHIVATSIYYYDVDNVTESRIQFRQESRLDDRHYSLEYDHGNHGPIEDAYGARQMHDCHAIQETGSVVTRQDRLLVFPNIVQHRVEAFRLQDPTRPGHRRFLVIWLVDPHYRVISTRNVAPQQQEWWRDKQLQSGGPEDSLDGLMIRTEAEKFRLELMKERTTVMDGVRSHYESYHFCEH